MQKDYKMFPPSVDWDKYCVVNQETPNRLPSSGVLILNNLFSPQQQHL
uniref:SOX n=1 Tax=Arundo donax TaxID=35708 RepID=A0A0A9GZ91_ARUDO